MLLNVSKKSSCNSMLHGIFVISFHIAIILFIIILYKKIAFHNSIYSTIFIITAVFFIGTRMRALGNIIHECAHGTFVPSRTSNIFIGNALSIMEFGCFDIYRKEHFAHHRYLGNTDRDPDFIQRVKTGIYQKNVFKIKNFFLIIFSPYHWFLLIKQSFSLTCKNKKDFLFRVFYFLCLFLLLYLIGINIFILFIIIPYLTTYQMMKIFSDLYDHGEIYFLNKKQNKTRNHYFSLEVLNLIFFPRNDAFHLVHHLYPSIPACELKKTHYILLRKNKEYRERKHHII